MSCGEPGASRAATRAELAIRPATKADLPALVRLELDSFDDPWSEALLAAEVASSPLLLLAEVGGRGAGYAAFLEAADEAELLRVAVDPTERRRGLGRRLVEAGVAVLRRRGTIRCHLEVRPDNEAALALYRTLGFEVSGRRPGYFSDGTAALLLTLELAQTREPPAS